MIILPLGTYWFSLNYIFQGTFIPDILWEKKEGVSWARLRVGYNYTKAGVTAIVAAHIVLFSYIYVAINEDSEDKEGKKRQ
jgi:VMA21-like domain